MPKSRPRPKTRDNARRGKKKVSVLTHERVEYIDYKDVNLLRRFISDRAKIRARRVTANDAHQQRTVARAIKNAREMALLPYANKITTQRGAGRSDGPRDGAPGRRGAIGRLDPTRTTRRRWPLPTGRLDTTTADAPPIARRRRRAADGCRRIGGVGVVKVVLRTEVATLGRRGDICDVADGYAQNYLIPRGLAMRATRGSTREAEVMRRRRELADAAVLGQAREMAERLAGRSIRIVARAGETGRLFGSVNAGSLAAAIGEQERVVLDPDMLDLPESLKQVGTYTVRVTPHPDVATDVTVEVIAAS